MSHSGHLTTHGVATAHSTRRRAGGVIISIAESGHYDRSAIQWVAFALELSNLIPTNKAYSVSTAQPATRVRRDAFMPTLRLSRQTPTTESDIIDKDVTDIMKPTWNSAPNELPP